MTEALKKHRTVLLAVVSAVACAAPTSAPRTEPTSKKTAPPATSPAPVAPSLASVPTAPVAPVAPGQTAQPTESASSAPEWPAPSTPAERGERPWWAQLKAGVYGRPSGPAVMAIGRSADHHHPAEGFLQAKVQARLAVRRAAGLVAFRGPMPEPYIEDLFITPDGTFMALYRLDVPGNAGLPDSVAAWAVPNGLLWSGRRRVGRHVFEGSRHLFLECDVEGPIANPDWGQTRASAWLQRPRATPNPAP